jgi:2-methylisocitrate lyase-like PEP mutase family enzyme
MSSQMLAKTLKALHKPGNQLILANVDDTISAFAVASLDNSEALATGSFAVAVAP